MLQRDSLFPLAWMQNFDEAFAQIISDSQIYNPVSSADESMKNMFASNHAGNGP